MAAEADNLDARMEAIRLKNEELEKKHKEILEDELNAKRENAVVDLKAKSDIPKAHPYDELELDFDVKEAERELVKHPETGKPKNRRPMPRKEFLDEIPPDPVNFLREDGDDTATKPEPNQSQRNNKNPRNRPERQRSNNETGGDGPKSADSPPRAHNNNQRSRQQNPRSPPQDGTSPRKPPQQLRTERRSAPSAEHQSNQPQQQPNRQRRPNNRPPNKEGGDVKNITVQVTDGEVRSVKLKSEKTFGTGRVGHSRQPNENAQKFTVDTFNPDNCDDKPQGDDKARNRNPRNNQNRRNQKPKEFKHPTLENMIIPKASVQDRLLKIAKDTEVSGDANAGD